MNIELLKQWRISLALASLLASVLTISACQEKPEPEPSPEDNISTEESVPMSAEPAEHNDIVVNNEDVSLHEVEDDSDAAANTNMSQ